MRARIKKLDGHHFQFDVRGMHGDIDVTPPEVKAQGPSPKELILSALCGCTGTDVIDLLAKFQVTYDSLELEAKAPLTDKHPKVFSRIDLSYFVNGASVDPTKVIEAAKRSTHQYSGTAAMLSKACPIYYTVHVNNEKVAEDQVHFE
ncbi:OsmC family protein [uncultured Bdellovibrio sp.]|uniref:OsmC family protein n=1 Tax=Bdellovibrio sp. HCB-162 TaxID=3394234 RepID=UPI0025CE54B2|nr:OsmC family protein [uncultured Bdellovibrio sp.]